MDRYYRFCLLRTSKSQVACQKRAVRDQCSLMWLRKDASLSIERCSQPSSHKSSLRLAPHRKGCSLQNREDESVRQSLKAPSSTSCVPCASCQGPATARCKLLSLPWRVFARLAWPLGPGWSSGPSGPVRCYIFFGRFPRLEGCACQGSRSPTSPHGWSRSATWRHTMAPKHG